MNVMGCGETWVLMEGRKEGRKEGILWNMCDEY
jgi:hypothetical protein